ncbi:MAG: aminotransferase class I/II-fold pyridoxal phosphate-dependent enzyme [Gammaproteobacteria bacterium]|nr:DegT/DnrJ/EryC1/StrS family aminotransferase [Gammaproteobacteria bacterium]NIP87907.1 DegT/DnrJ/EryC1/StrS family aminotransferase [Gammaproteobacteria bacterium]NIR22065.1 DegT/DnrJ/EryC1/StrS family aminotransferase [Gammaproteobacteria bacterium]NIS03747.1 DegT/DnrJ/EryC1/StrS family aminotransferase [Gammaproteobacteria bacterium]NIU42187.1 aminotransferase class I/II-fold pyridoxal phosphate-dependent enzyme [Gammaproteobacteria bacterium]
MASSAEANASAGENTHAPIPFIDLQAQRRRIADKIEAAVQRVIEHGAYIMGPEVAELEEKLAAFAGVRHAISCANGTDALLIPLMAKGIGPGDAVFLPAFTFTATAEVAALIGATPVFVDVDPVSFNMDPQSLAASIAETRKGSLRPAAVIPVDLFGQPADYPSINAIAEEQGLLVLEDAAQSFGARLGAARTCALAEVAATSFFPAKPLGCYGDGGALFTDDDALADLCRSIRQHGQGGHKYDIDRVGLNSRMDTLQAAILIEKLAIFDDEIERRQRIAERYDEGLRDIATTPVVAEGATSTWAQYTLQVADRDALAAALKAQGIPTAIYYPRTLSRQQAYRAFPKAPDGIPVAERLSQSVLSLPMHPYLDAELQARIVAAVRAAVAA